MFYKNGISLELKRLTELGSTRREITKTSRKKNAVFDPQLSLRQGSSTALEEFQCDLINWPQQCALTNILIPSVEKIQLHHCYMTLTDQDKPLETSMNGSHITQPLILSIF